MVSKITVPKITVPKITVPKITVPKITVSKIMVLDPNFLLRQLSDTLCLCPLIRNTVFHVIAIT